MQGLGVRVQGSGFRVSTDAAKPLPSPVHEREHHRDIQDEEGLDDAAQSKKGSTLNPKTPSKEDREIMSYKRTREELPWAISQPGCLIKPSTHALALN